MKLRYVLLDPTKNITALVIGLPPRSARRAIAAAVMRREPACEQVGFAYQDGSGLPCLQMAGGEFCGNASMSAAALYCARSGIAPGQKQTVTLRVSGAPQPVRAEVAAKGGGGFACTVTMPPPERFAEERLAFGDTRFSLPAVYFPGIAHVVAPHTLLSRGEAEQAVRRWCADLGVKGLGLMLLNEEELKLTPLVYIPAANTLFWESSCASGTAAVGAYLSRRGSGEADLTLEEPGGALRVRARGNDLLLSGNAEILAEREIVI